MRLGYTTLIRKVKCKVWPGNMPVLHHLESFVLLHRLEKLWPLYPGMLQELYWLSWSWKHYHRNLLRWSDQKSSNCTEGDRESCVAGFCFTRTMHLLIRRVKHWLPYKILALNCFSTHHIRQIWRQVTTTCLLNSRNSWTDANLLIIRTLSVLQMTGWRVKMNSSSTMASELWRSAGISAFLLQETMLKNDNIWRGYLVVKCVMLQTFWTPLVLHSRTKLKFIINFYAHVLNASDIQLNTLHFSHYSLHNILHSLIYWYAPAFTAARWNKLFVFVRCWLSNRNGLWLSKANYPKILHW